MKMSAADSVSPNFSSSPRRRSNAGLALPSLDEAAAAMAQPQNSAAAGRRSKLGDEGGNDHPLLLVLPDQGAKAAPVAGRRASRLAGAAGAAEPPARAPEAATGGGGRSLPGAGRRASRLAGGDETASTAPRAADDGSKAVAAKGFGKLSLPNPETKALPRSTSVAGGGATPQRRENAGVFKNSPLGIQNLLPTATGTDAPPGSRMANLLTLQQHAASTRKN